MMSILVVGGTGSLGNKIAVELTGQGHNVVALVRGGRSHPRSKQLLDVGVRIVEGDLCMPETFSGAISGIDTVVCGATSMPSAPNDGLRTVDRDGTLALIEAAQTEGVSRFLYVSYSGNIREDSPLETAKRDCENRLLSSKLETVILRPSFFMEVWVSPALGFDPANGSVRLYGSGSAKVSYISSSSVADFAVATASGEMNDKNTILELGGPEALSQLEVVGIFEQMMGRKMRVTPVPIEALRGQHQSSDPLQKTFGALMLAYANGDVVNDALLNAQQYQIKLRSMSEYASGLDVPFAGTIA
jgi:NADH dehydrogenase